MIYTTTFKDDKSSRKYSYLVLYFSWKYFHVMSLDNMYFCFFGKELLYLVVSVYFYF